MIQTVVRSLQDNAFSGSADQCEIREVEGVREGRERGGRGEGGSE